MDGGAWWATIHRVARSKTWLKQLSMHTCTLLYLYIEYRYFSFLSYLQLEAWSKWPSPCWVIFLNRKSGHISSVFRSLDRLPLLSSEDYSLHCSPKVQADLALANLLCKLTSHASSLVFSASVTWSCSGPWKSCTSECWQVLFGSFNLWTKSCLPSKYQARHQLFRKPSLTSPLQPLSMLDVPSGLPRYPVPPMITLTIITYFSVCRPTRLWA